MHSSEASMCTSHGLMAIPGAFQHSPALPILTTLFVATALVLLLPAAHVEGRHHRSGCPPFSCGNLSNVSPPFRRRGDPPGCGDESYELSCSDTLAAIHIDNATYYVTSISKSGSTFWVVDASLNGSSCPLPRWDRLPITYEIQYGIQVKLAPDRYGWMWATFVRCWQQVKNNGMYRPVDCLSTTTSFVYVLTGYRSGPDGIGDLEPSCGYLAMTPLGVEWNYPMPRHANLSYIDVVESMRRGFALRFPFTFSRFWDIKVCITRQLDIKFQGRTRGAFIKDWVVRIILLDQIFILCATERFPIAMPYRAVRVCLLGAAFIFKLVVAFCRFVLAPLAVLIFLVYQYWKTRTTIDAVEKFLRMQQMIGPTRYVYTDITAITRHFANKLGQGGYGSVYKGVLLPGHVHVAVKMLGTSTSNGEEFISEVATIGRIHHVKVVRLVGFCSEEMRRALVYEYMPHGSLDKYIFSSEKRFSWDKLNEIALGIARGIDYLHQGCDMQILHFDIKPHNILLDNNFVPKVADFGLAKLCPRDKSFMPLSALRGTIGYIAPEMISRSFGVISSKSDVYSFGMLLLEMSGGRRNADPTMANSSQAYYPSWVYSQLVRQEVGKVTDTDDMHELERKLCVIGLWCIQMKSSDRPMMGEVIEMLEGGIKDLQLPPKPFFCEDDRFPVVDSYHFSNEMATISEEDAETL